VAISLLQLNRGLERLLVEIRVVPKAVSVFPVTCLSSVGDIDKITEEASDILKVESKRTIETFHDCFTFISTPAELLTVHVTFSMES
jgi:hypothetical protein